MAELVGQVLLNRYKIIEFLGRGGIAEVYLAHDGRRDIPVALKFLREDLSEDRSFRRRFKREAQTLAKFQNLVSLSQDRVLLKKLKYDESNRPNPA